MSTCGMSSCSRVTTTSGVGVGKLVGWRSCWRWRRGVVVGDGVGLERGCGNNRGRFCGNGHLRGGWQEGGCLSR